MRNINTNSSNANVLRFSAQATVMLRGNGMLAIDAWRPDCAGSIDGIGLISTKLEFKRTKPLSGEARLQEPQEPRVFRPFVQHPTQPASYLFQSLS